MAELNFGLLTPPGSQSIGNAFVQGMDQAAVARAQENQNALAQYTLSKAKREDEVNNRLLSDLRAAKTPEEQMQAYVYAGRAKDALAMQGDILKNAKIRNEILAQPGLQKKTELDNQEAKAKFFLGRLPTLSQNPDDAAIGRYLREAVDAGVMSFEEANAKSADLLSKSIPDRRLQMLQGGQSASDTLKALQPRRPNMATDLLIPGPNGTMVPNTALIDVKKQLAILGRAPAQPSPPTITQIVDPSNPNQMITIDARRYAGGGSGSAGVIGVSGKEPSAALRENKAEAGKTLLADEISNVRNSLNILNANRAIPSTERGSWSNIGSSIAASGVGQLTGRMVGTEAQTERDLIASSKLRLTNAIKQASGMTAAQLNSNVELQTMLKSISDPAQSIETNLRNLDNIEKAYVNVTPPVRPSTPTGASLPAPTAPVDMSAAARAEIARRAAAKR